MGIRVPVGGDGGCGPEPSECPECDPGPGGARRGYAWNRSGQSRPYGTGL